MPPRAAASPMPVRSSSRLKERKTATPKAAKKAATPKAAPAAADVVQVRSAELAAAREELTLSTAPLKVIMLFLAATREFALDSGLALVRSRVALALVYPIIGAYLATRAYFPEWYAPPDCLGGAGGLLFYPQLAAHEFTWWLVLGILSSIGLGTGLHSGIMFLWPFTMSVITNAEACQSTAFSATYNHPCCLKCDHASKGDGTLSFFNTFALLAPSVIVWGCGTAIGELPPYFITRAARRAGKQATDFEAELNEAREKTDIISKLKVWTISFTERYGFVGIFLLASWPNAAFDMCGMACGWLEMPFWTFFGATLLGKGVVKVTLQTCVCIGVFGPAFWSALLSIVPSVSLPAAACKAAGVPAGVACTLKPFLEAGRQKMMFKFSLQRRMLPSELLGTASAIDERTLVDKYCSVMQVCGERGYTGSYANSAKHAELATVAKRAMASLDADQNGNLVLSELEAAVGTSDGKLSLASLDPGVSGLLSVGNLWNAFIAGLIIFFVVSIVTQVAISQQAALDEKELAALEASATATKKKK